MKKTLTIIGLLAIVGCAAPLIKPTQSDVDRANKKWEGTNLAALERGRLVYSENCGKCHKLYAPKAFSTKKWEHELAMMKQNVPLVSNDDYKLVERYVLTMCEAPTPSK